MSEIEILKDEVMINRERYHKLSQEVATIKGNLEMGMPTCKEHEAMSGKVIEMHRAIYGNGDPKKGLYWMVEGNTEFINFCRTHFWKFIWVCVTGVSAAAINLIFDLFRFYFKHS